MAQFRRKCTVTIGNKQFNLDQLDIDFDIKFDDEPEPDISEVMIYNLSDSSVAGIAKGQVCSVSAGYGDDTGAILIGAVQDYEVEQLGADTMLRLFVGDGIEAWSNRTIAKSFKAGTDARTVLGVLLKELGLEVGELSPFDPVVYHSGIAFNGPIRSAIERVAADTGSKFIIKNGTAYLRPLTASTATGFVLSPSTGLIDSPMKTEKGFIVRCLLNPRITIDTQVRIEARRVSGLYRVVKGSHFGDFITEIEVVPV